jgi:hypothetical protein
MPTPKFTPGAQIFPITLTAPSFFGLNTEQGATILGREWATTLDNAVFDDAGRPAARKGLSSLTGTPGSGVIRRIFEYYKADGTSDVIFSTDANIYNNVSTPTAIEGTLTISEGNIKFGNFNDKVIAFGIGTGGIPAVKTTGNFADITVNSGTAPTGGIGTTAFGRLWGVDADGKTLRYSALLDETRWATVDGGGSIDFSKVWPAGQDDIVAVTEFGGDLVVFGSNNTVIMTDGQGAQLGIDPTALYVSDTLPGRGAVSQFALARAAGDLWVLTRSGITGLKRELIQKSTPVTNISKNVQSLVTGFLNDATDVDDITMEYSPQHDMVLCVFPDSGSTVYFDTRFPLEDGAFRATTWTTDLSTIAYERAAQRVLGGLKGTVGEIFNYTGSDEDGITFAFDYESGWLDLGEELNIFLKYVKRLTSFIFIEQNVAVTHKIAYDFNTTNYTIQKAATGGRGIEWGQFEWGTNGVYDIDDADAVAGTDYAEWAGGTQLRTMTAPGQSGGQYIRIGLSLNTNAGAFALQQINLYAKVGRHAT